MPECAGGARRARNGTASGEAVGDAVLRLRTHLLAREAPTKGGATGPNAFRTFRTRVMSVVAGVADLVFFRAERFVAGLRTRLGSPACPQTTFTCAINIFTHLWFLVAPPTHPSCLTPNALSATRVALDTSS